MQTQDVDSRRAVDELKELAELTGGPDGARRVAWTDEWVRAREWLTGKLEEIEGVEVERDEAGNIWATAPGDSEGRSARRAQTRFPTAAGSTAP